jgi:mannosyltransferase
VKTIGFDAFAFRMQKYGGISKLFQEIVNGLNHEEYQEKIRAVITEHIPSDWQDRISAASIGSDNTGNRYINSALRRIPKFGTNAIDLRHLSYYSKAPMVFPTIPYALTIHDFTPELYPELMEAPGTHLAKMRLIPNAQLLFCVSETTKEHLLYFFPKVSEEKIVVAYPGPSVVKTERLTSGSRPYFLIVGRNDKYKNFKLVFDVIKEFPDHDFVFFGTAKSQIPARYLFEFQKQIHLTSGDSELLSMYYRGAEAYINPTFSEGFCIPVLDALVSKCPAIVSDIPVFREVYGNSVSYFDPFDRESLVNAMKKNDPSTLTKFESEKYSWSNLVKSHVSNYLKVIERG